jgi:PPE-repeat protein
VQSNLQADSDGLSWSEMYPAGHQIAHCDRRDGPGCRRSDRSPGNGPGCLDGARGEDGFRYGAATAGAAAVGVHGFGFPYLIAIGGDPGIGFDSGASTRAGASAKLQAPAETGAVAAAAATRRRARGRRRQQVQQREYAHAFMDLEVDPDRDAPMASDRGAGSLGFAGTVAKGSEQAAGLATLPGDDFGGGPSMPMLPHTWWPEAPRGEGTDGP